MKLQARAVRRKERIYKTITSYTSRGRAWRAISEPHEFGVWFGVSFDTGFHRPFAPGVTLTGVVTPTGTDRDEVTPVELTIVDVDPDHRVSFHWRPYAAVHGVDAASEATMLVDIQLETEPEGVVVTVTESGFGRVPAPHRLAAFLAHDGGWDQLLMRLKHHLETNDPTPRRDVTVEAAAA